MPLVEIPVWFEHEGKEKLGYFVSPDSKIWYLTYHAQYIGTLTIRDGAWHFKSNDSLEDLTDYFGDVVMAWYQ